MSYRGDPYAAWARNVRERVACEADESIFPNKGDDLTIKQINERGEVIEQHRVTLTSDIQIRYEKERPMMYLREAIQRCHETARSKGWWDDAPVETGKAFPDMVAGKLMLIVSEASEALEDLRNGKSVTRVEVEPSGKPVGFASELADIVIRTFDLAGYLGIDLAEVIEQKMAYNKSRPFRHGGKIL